MLSVCSVGMTGRSVTVTDESDGYIYYADKKVDFTVFRLAQNDLADYLLAKLSDALRKINVPVSVRIFWTQQAEIDYISNLCDPELVEENFGDLIRKAIKARFNEVLTAGSQESVTSVSSSATQSTSEVKEKSVKKQRTDTLS